MSPRLVLQFLGLPQVKLEDKPIATDRRKAIALLAYLAVNDIRHPHQKYPRESLSALFWPDYDQSKAFSNLRRTIWEVHQAIGEDWLHASRDKVGLNKETDIWLDVAHFKFLLEQSHKQNDVALRISLLTDSAKLYRNHFLTGFSLKDASTFNEWAFAESEELRLNLAEILNTLSEDYCAISQADHAIPYARRLITLDPLNEAAHRRLMEVYIQAGQHSAALKQYQTCEQILRKELGLDPQPETRALYKRIRKGDIKPVQAIKPEPVISEHILSMEPTLLIGRETDLANLAAWLGQDEGRLLTIVGPGGIGKTRLVLACAAQLFEDSNRIPSAFPHGLYFVDLAPLSEAAHIVPTLAEAMHFSLQGGERDQRSPKQQVIDYLREKRMLLLLDNFEHLLEGADLVADILQTATHVKILVTSRERLHLRQEQVYPLQGLEFPATILKHQSESLEEAEVYAAVKLFIQAAQRTRPDFQLNRSDDLTCLAHICRLVEGMPLALELAAAWVDTLPLAKIALEIQAGLDFLESEMRDAPARHRSIRATIDCSWQKLTAAEQTVFAQLAVFRGGFTWQAGQTITGASLPLLARLVNKSFLQYHPARDRYQVHELMRQFGAEQLATDQERETAIRNEHSTYYCQSLAARTADLKGSRQKEAITEIESDGENTRAAWNWAVRQRDFALLEQAAFSLTRFYEWNGRFQECEEAVTAAIGVLTHLQASPNQQRVLVHLLHLQCARPTATIAERRGFLEQTLVLLAHLGQTGTDVTALQADDEFHRGFLYETVGDYPQAERALENSLTYYQQSGKKWEAVGAWLGLGNCTAHQGNYSQAEAYTQQALALAHSIGDRLSVAMALTSLSGIANNQGQFALSRRFAEESLEIAQELGQLWMQGRMLMEIGTSFTAEGQQTGALPYHQESLAVLRQMGDRQNMAETMAMLAWDNMGLDDIEAAEHWLQEANELAREIQSMRTLAYCLITRCCLDLMVGQYDKALIHGQEADTVARGAGVGVDILATVHVFLGWTQLVHEKPVQAEKSSFEALTMRNVFSYDAFLPIAYLLVWRLPTADRVEQAWQLIGLYEHSALLAKSGLLKPLSERIQPPALFNLPAKEIEAAKARGRTLDPDTVIAELIKELPKLGWGEGWYERQG